MSFLDDGVELVVELGYWVRHAIRDWGLKLEQLYQMYDWMMKAWESQKFVSTVTFSEIWHVGGGEKERTHRLSEYEL